MCFPEPGAWFRDLSLPSECIFLPSAKPVPARGVNGISCLSPAPPLPSHRDAPAETQSHPLPPGLGQIESIGSDSPTPDPPVSTRPSSVSMGFMSPPPLGRVGEEKHSLSEQTRIGAERRQVRPGLNRSTPPPALPAPRGEHANPHCGPGTEEPGLSPLQSRCGEGKRGAGRGRQIFLSLNNSQPKP